MLFIIAVVVAVHVVAAADVAAADVAAAVAVVGSSMRNNMFAAGQFSNQINK